MKTPIRVSLAAAALLAFAACRNEQSSDYSTGQTPDADQNRDPAVLDDTTDRDAGRGAAGTGESRPADQTGGAQDIVATAKAAGRFSTLAKALEKADLVETLQGAGPFTVFAPTDEAFAKLPADALQALLDDPERLGRVLTFHVVSGELKASDVRGKEQLQTLQGGNLEVSVEGDTVRIGGATVVQADVDASNGVIHAIDTVLQPK